MNCSTERRLFVRRTIQAARQADHDGLRSPSSSASQALHYGGDLIDGVGAETRASTGDARAWPRRR